MRTISAGILLMLIVAIDCSAADLGTFGTVYEIAEPDALEEIETAAKNVDWKKAINPTRLEGEVKSMSPSLNNPPARATEDKTFAVDMTYTLDFDIPDGKGGILYPKGYTFNPLDYMVYPTVLIFINANDQLQIKWLQKSGYRDKAKVLLTGGNTTGIPSKFKLPVYFASQKAIDRFQIKAVPSVVLQNGHYMEVRQYAIKEEK